MKRQLSFQEYRAIDLAMLAALLCVTETLIVKAATLWFADQLYTVSVVGALTAIVLMRWGPWAAIHAALGGAVFCLASHGSASQFAIYCLGNLFSLAALPLIPLLGGDEGIRGDVLKTLLYGLIVLLLMQLGRAAVSLAFQGSLQQALLFFTTDAVTDLFTLVILWIVRRLDGMLENQYHYLARLEREQEKERGGYR